MVLRNINISQMQRLENLAQNFKSEGISSNPDDDVVICAAVRTPITRGKKGGLKDTAPEVMLSFVLREAVARANIKPEQVQDITVGNNSQPGAG
jgi:acetyl-CoA acyltransferase 1